MGRSQEVSAEPLLRTVANRLPWSCRRYGLHGTYTDARQTYPAAPYNGLNKARRRIYQAAGIEGADAHCLRHTFETIAFVAASPFGPALTGRALTKDPTQNEYLHPDDVQLREAADKVARRLAQAMGGELADVVPIEARR